MTVMEGELGLRRSLKGSRPLSSWKAMTPADQRSLAGSTAELSTSGAMYQGVPSRPRSRCGRLAALKGTANPKSEKEDIETEVMLKLFEQSRDEEAECWACCCQIVHIEVETATSNSLC